MTTDARLLTERTTLRRLQLRLGAAIGALARADTATLVCLTAGVCCLVVVLRALAAPWLVVDDYRAHFFWLGQARRPELFRNDLLATYFQDFLPPALAAVYRALARVVAPVTAPKLVNLVVVMAYFPGVWYLARRLFPNPGPARGVFAICACAAPPVAKALMGGFSRGFAPPLAVWCLGLLLAGRPWLALLCVAGGMLLHPISFVTLGGLFAVWWVAQAWAQRDASGLRPHLALGAAALALGLFGVWQVRGHSLHNEQHYGPVLTHQEALRTAPEWGPLGRFEEDRPLGLVADAYWAGLGTARQMPAWVFRLAQVLIGVAVLAGAAACWRRWVRLPALLVGYSLAAVAGYYAALVELPRFYAPNRYLFPAVLLVAGALIAASTTLWPRWRGRSHAEAAEGCAPARPSWPHGRAASWLRAAAPLICLALVCAADMKGFAYNLYTMDLRPCRPMAAWLRAHLAAGKSFAAFPAEDADNLMTVSERPCLMTYECDQPIYSGYRAETGRRLGLLFRAYYAYERADVLPLARETPVRFLVVRSADVGARLRRGRTRGYPAPYGRQLRRWAAAHAGSASYWLSPQAPSPVYEDGTYAVFDLRPFREGEQRTVAQAVQPAGRTVDLGPDSHPPS